MRGTESDKDGIASRQWGSNAVLALASAKRWEWHVRLSLPARDDDRAAVSSSSPVEKP